jgi:hypothetical protein
MLRYIIWTFILYWLFRFIFNFLVPVFRATRQMKEQVRDFQSRMDGQGNNFQKAPQNPPPGPQPQEKPKGGDYIEFEEIK